MIFRRKSREVQEEAEEQIEYVLFKGTLNGVPPDLASNGRLAQAALVPAKEIITEAIMRRAEMVRIDPKGSAAIVRLYVDGIPYPAARMPRQQGMAITQMMKLLAGLDIRVRNRPQSGGLNAEHEDVPYRLKVQVAPAEEAERLLLRIENMKTRPERPEDLGFSQAMKDHLRELTSSHPGAFFCVGPSNSGVTTTTFGVLRALDPYTRTILTIGDPQGERLIAINPYAKQSEDEPLETTLNRVLRIEPNVLFVDRVTDEETARTLFKYTDVVSFVAELAARDVASALRLLIQWTGDPNIVAEGVRGLISPKLIRRLCTKCRQVFKPNPKMLGKLGLPPETQMLYRPPQPPVAGTPEADAYQPCNKCGGMGYLGRIGIFEMLEMTSGMKEVVLAGADPKQVRHQMRSEEMQTFQREALRLVAEGVTSLEEVKRAFQQPA